MLIVQRITTEWTKASRGGVGATLRNATPDVLEIPSPTRTMPGYILHDVRYSEHEHFECHSRIFESDAQTHIRIEPVCLHLTKHTVAARFVWSWRHCGAPERDPHDVFQLSHGEWGRFTCNGRFGAESSSGREWGYHKTVFNIALTDVFDVRIFTKTDPIADDSRLAILK